MGVDLFARVADVGGHRAQPYAVGGELQAQRRGVAGEDLDPADGLHQVVAADGELVRVRLRDELAVVRELALDETGGETGGADLEGGIALAEAQGELTVVAEQPLQLGEGPRRHQHLLPFGQHVFAGKIAHGEAVAVGGDQAQAVRLGGEKDTGQDRAGLVGARRAHHLSERHAEVGRGQRDRVVGRRGEARVVVGGERTDAELRTATADRHVVLIGGHLDRAHRQAAHDVADQPRG